MERSYELGPDFSGGPEGPDRSLLAHVLSLCEKTRVEGNIGCAIEFGVGTGETLRLITQHMPAIGFDSFKGLPEDWRPGFPKGHFGSIAEPRDIPGATIVPGWFKDTLPNYEWPQDIHLVHIDCDLFSSTLDALCAIENAVLPGTYFVFDEWFGFPEAPLHEEEAWRVFVAGNHWDWRVVGHGREQWAIQITKVGK